METPRVERDLTNADSLSEEVSDSLTSEINYPVQPQVKFWMRIINSDNKEIIADAFERYEKYLHKIELGELRNQGEVLKQVVENSVKSSADLSVPILSSSIYNNLRCLFQVVEEHVPSYLYVIEGQVNNFSETVLEEGFSKIIKSMFDDFSESKAESLFSNSAKESFYSSSNSLLELSTKYGFSKEIRAALIFELRHLRDNISFGGDVSESLDKSHPFVTMIQNYVNESYYKLSFIHEKTIGLRFDLKDVRKKIDLLDEHIQQMKLFLEVFNIDDSVPDLAFKTSLPLTLKSAIQSNLVCFSNNIEGLKDYCKKKDI